MNPLVIAFWVLLAVIFTGWVAASFGALIITASEAWDHEGSWLRPLVALASTVAAITIGIVVINATISTDDSVHCGPGTHYVELHDGKYSTWECTT